ncbi:DUF6969 family protein [Leucothrix arctica]|uniref:DUF6969 domain-containing protein n=1 Tax=Leucothrix arctica TaxID=1481894 RepID=A0A317C8W5_9GAMM|nr:hypothetical protein [Leucothrix arctica]PWQ94986.1 hypothetical protein DKT75_13710 [Leucothrix arctica]
MDDLKHLSKESLSELLVIGQQLKIAALSLKKGGLNIVGECLKGQGDFYELSHYPQDDVYDAESKSQYYFHAHRGINGEYGHFHTFMRAPGMHASAKPIKNTSTEPWPSGNDALSHLVCISMNQEGVPIGLFTTNRWVTGEAWYRAEDVVPMIDQFEVDHAFPNLAVNLWISAMFRFYKSEIAELIVSRDEVIGEWQSKYLERDVFEDRDLEIASFKTIDVDQKIIAIQRALDA